jgi:dynamin GTPase
MATQTASERFAGAMENLILLADTMQQATALISGDEDGEEAASRSSSASFMNVVPLGNVGAGKSAVLNSLVGHPVLPTGENGATRVPIVIEMERDKPGSNRGLCVVLEGRTQTVSASNFQPFIWVPFRWSLQELNNKWL